MALEIYRLAIEFTGQQTAEDHMATGPDLRIGHAEREAAAASLREHYAQGRLTLEEFNERLDAAFKATTQSQLNRVTQDLPRATVPSAALPVTTVPGGGRDRARQEWSTGGRPRFALFPLVIAAIGTWFLILDLHLRAFPWPGKLAIFLAIFAVIRGVLRRVFGGIGRRGRVRGHGGCGRGRTRGGRYSGGPWSGI
jgi:Domain of unknown function (DUF1707)